MVTGTGGDGLRVRPEAGLSQGVRFLAGEGEMFQVQDGPVEIDGYTWWYLVKSEDTSRGLGSQRFPAGGSGALKHSGSN